MPVAIRFLHAPGRRDALHDEKLWRELEGAVWHATGGAGSPQMRADPYAQLSGRPGVGWTVSVLRRCRGPSGQLEVFKHYEWDERTGHAGRSKVDGKGNVNGRFIGVEFANLGEVERDPRAAGDAYRSVRWAREGKTVRMRSDSEIYQAGDGTLWEQPTDDQLEVWAELPALLEQVIGQPLRHVRHQDIKPGKWDPGPAFPWPF